MLDDVLPSLRCPYCRAPLRRDGPTVRCPDAHAFDVARQGYLNLLPGGTRKDPGDTAAMVRARAQFLARGHFAGLAERVAAVSAAAAADRDGCVVDAGAGTGYHLGRVLDAVPGRVGLALDVSKYAVRRAARAHGRIGAVVADVWRPLPVADAVASVVLDVFAPRNAAEFRRILVPGGALVVVTPTSRHLAELVPRLGLLTVDERKDERLAGTLGAHFTAAGSHPHEQALCLDRSDVLALASMGPSAWHVPPEELAGRVADLPEPTPVTVSVTVTVHRPA
ncbi:MAG: 23S rRNA methyltransferase [Streptosporangiales bacterium]|nr:23S rRNA methyltransferase [Streptosporangiales bacterium]